jgi:hypothetical protein
MATHRADFSVPSGTFVVVGDSRPPDYLEFFLEDSRWVPRVVFDAIGEERPACVVHAGDLAVFGSRESFWQGWQPFDRDARSLLEGGVPIYPALGNHEYRGFTRSPLARYFTRFAHLGERTFYSVRIGGILVVCLDSNFARMRGSREREQESWLENALAEARQDPSVWIVLPVIHHPPFTNVSPVYLIFESRSVQQRLVRHLWGHEKVAAVFSGHVHAYEHFVKNEIHFLVTGGGGSPRFRLKPRARCRHDDVWPGDERIRPFHYLRCRPDEPGRSLTVEVVCLTASRTWEVRETFRLGEQKRPPATRER